MKRGIPFALLSILTIISFVLAGCQITSTASPAASVTSLPTYTLTPTSTLTPTATLPPTATATPANLTPVITAGNIGKLVIADQWGIGYIYSAELSPDGEQFAVTASTGIYIYDVTSLSIVKFVDEPMDSDAGEENYYSRLIAFSPDGSKIAFGINEVEIWDLKTNEKINTISSTSESSRIKRISFSPDGKSLAVARKGLYNSCGATPGIQFSLYDASLNDVVFSVTTCRPDDFFFTFLDNGIIYANGISDTDDSTSYHSYLIDPSSGEIVQDFSDLRNITSISNDGLQFTQAITDDNGRVVTTNILDLTTKTILNSTEGLLAFLNDTSSRQILIRDNSWIIRDNAGNQVCNFADTKEFRYLGTFPLISVAADKLLSWNKNRGILSILDFKSCEEIQELPLFGVGYALQTMNNGSIIVTSTSDYTTFFDSRNEQIIKTIYPGKILNPENGFMKASKSDPTNIGYETFSTEKKTLIYRYYPNFAYFIWDADTLGATSKGETEPLYPINVALSPDGKTITYSLDTTIHFLTAGSSTEKLVINAENDFIFFDESGFSADSKKYISFDTSIEPQTIIVYNAETGDIEEKIEIPKIGYFNYLFYDKHLAVTADDDGFMLVDLDGTLLTKFEQLPSALENQNFGNDSTFTNAACEFWNGEQYYFNPDFTFFMTVCYVDEYSYMRIWDIPSGKIIRDVRLPFDMSDFTFSPDGRNLYSTANGLIYVWRIVDSE